MCGGGKGFFPHSIFVTQLVITCYVQLDPKECEQKKVEREFENRWHNDKDNIKV